MFVASLQKLMIAPDESAETLTLTATDPADPSVTASAAIHLVHESDLKLEINPQSAMFAAGKTLQLQADIHPEAAKNFELKWASSDDIVASVNANGLVSGLKAGKAVITASIGKVSAESELTVLFKDVANPSSYYFDPVYWALENGITTGYTDGSGKFGPNDKCTREQFATFLWRAAGKPVPEETKMFVDEKAGAYYVDAILWWRHRKQSPSDWMTARIDSASA